MNHVSIKPARTLADVAPTLLSLLKLPPSTDMTGKNFGGIIL
jgi:bisphosphoglycerate-independent phosphoglycerate mutase (AlkP superfamily)